MSNLVSFAFEDSLVRSRLDENGEPWFVAKDVALALGYPESSLRQLNNLFGHVPDEWKGRSKVMTLGGEQVMLIISEPGLYFFVARSDKPRALPFQKWLAGEVLPALRRHKGHLQTVGLRGYVRNTSEALPALRKGHYEMPGYRERMEQYRTASFTQPEAARYLRPAMRERLLSNAIQTAKMCGNTDPAFVDGLYARYCAMVAGNVQSPADRNASPETPLHREEQAAMVHRFVKERCTFARGMSKSATRLYVAFREWWQDQSATPPASQRLFGMIVKEYFPSRRRGGHFWYYDMALVGE